MSRRHVLQEDANSWEGNWFHLPNLILLGLIYIRALWKLFLVPNYNAIIAVDGSSMYENHLGNYAVLKHEPATWMVVSHMIMAFIWTFGTLTQKLLVWGMANKDRRARTCSRIHAVIGTAMCTIGIFGCTVGGLIAYYGHNHAPMRWFLMLLPCSFLPSIIMTWWSARRRDIIDHRFWATAAFIGPCLSSLWAEELIYRLGRQTPIGPWKGELWGTGIAAVLHFSTVVLPAWLVRRRQYAQKEISAP